MTTSIKILKQRFSTKLFLVPRTLTILLKTHTSSAFKQKPSQQRNNHELQRCSQPSLKILQSERLSCHLWLHEEESKKGQSNLLIAEYMRER